MERTFTIFAYLLFGFLTLAGSVYANAHYDSKVVPLHELEIRLPFTLTLDILYNGTLLQNSSSSLYMAISDEFLHTFRPGCLRLRGCLNVAVSAFRQHSTSPRTVIQIEVLYSGDVNLAEWKDRLGQVFIPFMTVITSLFFYPSVYLNQTEITTSDVLTTAIALQAVGRECSLLNPCDSAFNCVVQRESGVITSVTCLHKCTEHTCENGGLCFYDRPTGRVTCSCIADDDYVYMGPTCSTKIEILSLDSEYIILICAGGGGGVVMALLIVLCVTYYNKWVKPKNRILRRKLAVAMATDYDRFRRDQYGSRSITKRTGDRDDPAYWPNEFKMKRSGRHGSNRVSGYYKDIITVDNDHLYRGHGMVYY